MKLYAKWEPLEGEVLDSIELISKDRKSCCTLEWDEAQYKNGEMWAKGVHIIYPEDDSDQTYGNGRIEELKDYQLDTALTWNIDHEELSREIDSLIELVVEDNGKEKKIC